MRDILVDLQDRAQKLAQEIRAEHARFYGLVAELRAKQDERLETMRAELLLANKLLDFAAWHDRIKASLAAQIAVTELAEDEIKKSYRAGAGFSESEPSGAELAGAEGAGSEPEGSEPEGAELAGTEPVGSPSRAAALSGAELAGVGPVASESAAAELAAAS